MVGQIDDGWTQGSWLDTCMAVGQIADGWTYGSWLDRWIMAGQMDDGWTDEYYSSWTSSWTYG